MNMLRGVYRLCGFLILTSITISKIIFLGLVKGKDIKRAIHLRRKLAQQLVRFLNVQVEVTGTIPSDGVLGITNHRSYIDSICIFKNLDACPVVKAEVGRWPIIGFGLRHSGTVFVDRKSKESRKRTREQIAELVRQGISTIVFVEGTTYVGPQTGEFRPGTFMTAVEGGFEVVPIAIEFEHQEMAWVGNDTFIPHFVHVFGKYRETRVKVAFGEPIKSTEWEQLRDDCQAWVNAQLLQMRAAFDNRHYQK
jgi:1-acyl-sn-glycerol-3-phosphate acyltransferase